MGELVKGCPGCVWAAGKIAALRADRTAWRFVAFHFSARCLNLEHQLSRLGNCESLDSQHPYRRVQRKTHR